MSDCCASSVSRVRSAGATPSALPSYPLRRGVTLPDWSVVTSSVARQALVAMAETEHVMHRWSDYGPDTDRVRTALLQVYAEAGRAPSLEAIAGRARLLQATVRALVADLRQRDLVVLDGEWIVGAYPFTDRDTGHHVMLNGRTLNAMCAVDALGIGAMIDRDVIITSRCRHCGAPIRTATKDRGTALAEVEPGTAVAWLSVRYEGACAATSLCAATAFFCTDDHLADWRRGRLSDEPGFRLSIDEGLQIGRAIFGPSLAVRYGARPGGAAGEARGAAGSASTPISKGRTGAGRSSGAHGRSGRSYDLAIVGAGSAGFSAAITAADQGAQVALIGSGTIGGTCVNIGCVPSKTLIRAAETLHNASAAARFAGIAAEGKVTDWRATIRQKDELVSGLRRAKYRDLLSAYDGVAFQEGAAQLNQDGVVVNGQRIAAGKVIITTGARPAVPAIPGIDTVPYLTSTTALDLTELPRTLLVIGGGYVGAELAQMFARAGVKVTLVCRSRLLPKAEPEISAALTGYFGDEGIAVIPGVTYRAIRNTERGVALTVRRDGQDVTLNADQVLVTTGRTPNTEGFGLVEHGVALAANGGIVIDDRMRTTRSNTFAAGDVTGRDKFVYMAAYGAKLAALNALNGDSLRYDNAAMPAVVFTDPQVASVGLTEATARAAGHEVRVSTIDLDQVPRALAARDTRGLIKLVAEIGSGRLLGTHILAPEGADSIQTAVLAIKHGLTVDDLADTLFPYLTTVEGLKLAALSFTKDVAKLSCCAG